MPSTAILSWIEATPLSVLTAVLVVIVGSACLAVLPLLQACLAAAAGPDSAVSNALDLDNEVTWLSQVSEGAALFAAIAGCVVLQWIAGMAPTVGDKWVRLRLQRRVQHASTGLLFAALFPVLPWKIAVGGLGSGFTGLGLVQLLRQTCPAVEARFLEAFGSLLKEEERLGAPPAALSFLGGSLLSILLFPAVVFQVVILGAALGDPAAAIAGELLRGPRLRGCKTLSGFSACAVVAGACAVAVVAWKQNSLPCQGHDAAAMDAGALGWVFVLCGLSTATAELLGDMGPLSDDNFAVIFGAGAQLCLLRLLARVVGLPLDAAAGRALELLFAGTELSACGTHVST